MTWKPARFKYVPTYQNDTDRNYQVSDLGEVVRVTPGQGTQGGRLTPTLHPSGCLYVKLGRLKVPLARLVALTHVGDPPVPTAIVSYRDGDKSNCRADNLVWRARPRVNWRREDQAGRVSGGSLDGA